MNFGSTFKDFCEKNQLTKTEAIEILERELKTRSGTWIRVDISIELGRVCKKFYRSQLHTITFFGVVIGVNERELYKGFLNKYVDIGIPHDFLEHRLFYMSGEVIDINDNLLVLQGKKGIRKIFLSDIIEIKEIRRGND